MLLLADLLAIFHGFVVMPIIVFAPLLLLFSKQPIVWLERAFVVTGVLTGLSFVFFGACVLTNWEKSLRTMAGAMSYNEGFVRHYLAYVGIDWPDIWTTWLIRGCIAIGVLRLGYLWWRDRTR